MNKNFCIAAFLSALYLALPFTANAGQDSQLRRFETTLKFGGSNHIVGFDTPEAHSILEWNSDTIDVGLDLKYNISDKVFAILEYNYSKIKGGRSIDDDVTNANGVARDMVYSVHGVDGRANDYKLNFGYKIYDPKIISLFTTAGAFYKDIKVTSTNGSAVDGGKATSFEGNGYAQQTHSQYYGAMLGLRLESKTENTKSFLQADLLIPVKYESDLTWYGYALDGSLPSYWSLRNNKNIHGDYGFRLKAEYGYKIKTSFIKYAKLYAYYERIEFNGLTETQSDSYGNFHIKGGSPDSTVEGSTEYESFGAGIAFEF